MIEASDDEAGGGCTPVDRLTLAYLAGLALASAARHPAPGPLLARCGVLATAIVVIARSRTRSRWLRLTHDFLPVVSVASIFEWTGPVIEVTNPQRWDEVFAAADRLLFGRLPSDWFSVLGRPWWLTDAASLVYVSYYLVPVVMAVALYRRGDRRAFDEAVFTVVAAFLVSYFCYFLAPTTGPRVALADEERVLGGGRISAAVRWFIRHAEGTLLDAFPSGHVALSLVFVALGWRHFPGTVWVLLPLAVGITFSTVYLSFHYVVDVVAGVALAASLPWIVPLLRRWVAPSAGSAAVVKGLPSTPR